MHQEGEGLFDNFSYNICVIFDIFLNTVAIQYVPILDFELRKHDEDVPRKGADFRLET